MIHSHDRSARHNVGDCVGPAVINLEELWCQLPTEKRRILANSVEYVRLLSALRDFYDTGWLRSEAMKFGEGA
jgi:hypothetical protein